MYFLDSNICIYFLKNTYPAVSKKWLSLTPAQIKISSIVKAELLAGAYKSQSKETTVQKVEMLLKPYEIIPFIDEMTHTYAQIKSDLENSGKIIGPNDLLIATITKYHNGIMVTNNVSEFERVMGLKTENWINPESGVRPQS